MFRMWAVKDDGIAEDLRDLARCLLGDVSGDIVSVHPRVVANLHLDELVIGECLVDRSDEAIVDPGFADLHDRLQLVTEGTEMTALFTAEHAAAV